MSSTPKEAMKSTLVFCYLIVGFIVGLSEYSEILSEDTFLKGVLEGSFLPVRLIMSLFFREVDAFSFSSHAGFLIGFLIMALFIYYLIDEDALCI